MRMPFITADAIEAGDVIHQEATITSHAPITVRRDGVIVGHMTAAQLAKVAPRCVRHPDAGRSMATWLLAHDSIAELAATWQENAAVAAEDARMWRISCRWSQAIDRQERARHCAAEARKLLGIAC